MSACASVQAGDTFGNMLWFVTDLLPDYAHLNYTDTDEIGDPYKILYFFSDLVDTIDQPCQLGALA